MSAYESISAVGGLLPTSLLERVRAGDTSLEGTSAESYGLVPGERLNDHITRSWNRLQTVWANFSTQLAELPEGDRATTLTRARWCRPLLDELGFAGLPTASVPTIEGKHYPISHEWADHVPVHIMGARLGIDRRAAGVAGAASSSPHGLVQEFLNRSDDHLWGIVTNGHVLRVLRDNASLTKQAFVEFDLQAMFDGELFSDFVVLWLACHRTRFEGDPPEKCFLERWSGEAAAAGSRALDKLRDGVEAAITALGSGFVAHKANAELRERLRSGKVTNQELQHQVLRIVYRLLFLLVAESRDLLHDPSSDPTAVERYKRFYSVDRLRTLAAQRRGTPHDDLWAGLNITMNGLWHDGVPELGLSPLGSSLWSPDSIAAIDGASIDNLHLLDAVRALCLVRDDEARTVTQVDYKNLGAEELGSVYESLLELHAEVDVDARTFELTTAAGNERKTTGSYYTPTSLISELLDSALDPVLAEAAKQPDPEAAILALNIVDPAAGSGHFLIAAAHRIAGRLASVRAGGGEPAPDQLRHALRDVVANCIHAIDVNPMAVELCKVSMWLEGTEPGKPLSFLDHRIVCGNALLGATPELLEDGIPNAAFAVLTGDDKAVVSSLKKRNTAARKGIAGLFSTRGEAIEELASAVDELDSIEESSVAAVERKAQAWNDLIGSKQYRNEVFAADLWCSAFVVPKVQGSTEILHDTYRTAVERPESVPDAVREAVEATQAEYAFLHLHLAFLDVFDREGSNGFDVVLGNPPWDQVETDPREFFASARPDIAGARSQAERTKMLDDLLVDDPVLLESFRAAERKGERSRHLITKSRRFPLSSYGRINTAPVFVEGSLHMVNERGMVGIIVPTGVATDKFNANLFSSMVQTGRVQSVFDFRNKGFFPGAASSQGNRFCLLTLCGLDRADIRAAIFFVFGAESTAELLDPERTFALNSEEIKRLNPETGTAPVFASRWEAELVARTFVQYPVLGEHPDSSWEGLPARILFQMGEAESTIYLRDQVRGILGVGKVSPRVPSSEDLPPLVGVVEGKMFHSFDHRFGSYSRVELGEKGVRALPRVTTAEHRDPGFTTESRKWLAMDMVKSRSLEQGWRKAWLLAFRDVTSRTDYRTVVSSMLPTNATDRSAPVVLFKSEVDRKSAFFVIVTNSFAFDFVARQKVGGTHLTFNVFRQIAIPTFESMRELESNFCGNGRWLLDRAAELMVTSWDALALAEALGAEGPFSWDDERRALIRAELDAFGFLLFEFERFEVERILSTFNIVRNRDENVHGEYRTKRLILERYDAMAEAAANGSEYETVLDPPPADPSLAHDPSTRPDWADWYLTGAD